MNRCVNMNTPLILLLVTFLVYCNAATPSQEDQSYVTSILSFVPEDERRQFLIHQLYLGYVLKHPNDTAIALSQEVTIKLYETFLRSYSITPVDTLVQGQLCFPSGECVDTDDPGVYP